MLPFCLPRFIPRLSLMWPFPGKLTFIDLNKESLCPITAIGIIQWKTLADVLKAGRGKEEAAVGRSWQCPESHRSYQVASSCYLCTLINCLPIFPSHFGVIAMTMDTFWCLFWDPALFFVNSYKPCTQAWMIHLLDSPQVRLSALVSYQDLNRWILWMEEFFQKKWWILSLKEAG